MIATTRSAKGLVVCGALAAGLLVGAIVGAGVTRASSLKSSDIHEKFIGSLIGQSFATAHDFFLDPDFSPGSYRPYYIRRAHSHSACNVRHTQDEGDEWKAFWGDAIHGKSDATPEAVEEASVATMLKGGAPEVSL